MFLAFNEMKKSKLKYSLIILMIALISFLTFFLSFLALGLTTAMSDGVKNINSPAIVLNQKANNNLLGSTITRKEVSEIDDEDATLVAFKFRVLNINGKDLNGQLYETNNLDSIPKLVEGTKPETSTEVAISVSAKNELNLKLGDELEDSVAGKYYKIVGFTVPSRYMTVPIVYKTLSKTYRYVNFMILSDDKNNADTKLPESIIWQDKETILKNIPGYKPQIISFSLIITFSVAIGAMIVSIFVYILTTQKAKMFGILKAQGIKNAYIIKSTFFQTFNIMILGIAIALGIVGIVTAVMPAIVPFLFSWQYMLMIIACLLGSAIIGTTFTFVVITKIDPLKAINQE